MAVASVWLELGSVQRCDASLEDVPRYLISSLAVSALNLNVDAQQLRHPNGRQALRAVMRAWLPLSGEQRLWWSR